VLECVVNISEGLRAEVVAAVAAACGPALLDVHSDPDHNRSVLTLAGSAGEVADAALALARAAVEWIDMSVHSGVHPRLGAVDVVPFVPLDDTGPDGLRAAGEVARAWAERVAAELAVPVFLYGTADPKGRSLPDVRRTAFRERRPDFGPAEPHPTAGAVAVGARPILVALNCELATGGGGGGLDADLAVARAIARAVRERDGGLPGVRALGFALASKGRAQVSMNLVDLTATGVEAACTAVRRAAAEHGTEVTAVELVGLLPAAELERCSGEFLAWSRLGPDLTIEARLQALAARPEGPPAKPERSEDQLRRNKETGAEGASKPFGGRLGGEAPQGSG
jgi:glutamate formiminotransferase